MDDINKLRKAQLLILDEIKRVCEHNNIRYFIDCGTLLGAVRHKGFIPWDDDIDVGMLKDDYERFIQIAPKELGNSFFLDNSSLNSDYDLPFSKVKLKGTKYLELKKETAINSKNEIFVDIFPYYNVSLNKIKRTIEGLLLSISAQCILCKFGSKSWEGEGIIKRIKFAPIVIVSKLLPISSFRSIIKKMININKNSNLVSILDGSFKSSVKWVIPSSYLKETVDILFENRCYKAPKEYKKVLTIEYGDYMKLPSESERKTHNIVLLDTGDYF